MHYKPRKTRPKVQTQKFDIDYRLMDLLEVQAKVLKKSRNAVFEQAIVCVIKHNFLFSLNRIKRKKFLVKEETLDLIEREADRLNISKNALVNKALKEYLTKFSTLSIKG